MTDISKQRLTYQIESLSDEKNYELWFIRMKALLIREDLFKYITIADYNYSAIIENDLLTESNQNATKTTSLMKLNLYDESLLQVRHISKSVKVEKVLKNLYSSKGFSSEFLLYKELFDSTLEKSNNKMKLYLNQVKRLYDQLTAKNVIIPEKVIFAWVLNNLSSNYETLITTITQSMRVNGSDSINLENLFSNLIDESKRLKGRDSDAITLAAKASNNSSFKPYNQQKVGKKKRPDLKCDHCHKKGHKADKCWVKHPNLRPIRKNREDSSENNEEIALTAFASEDKELDFDVASYHNEDTSFYSACVSECDQKITYKSVFSTFLKRSDWILDSGATTHVCCEKDLFKDMKSTSIRISWGNKSRIKASGIGSVPIIFSDTNTKAVLTDVLFVPEFDMNLISINLLLQKKCKVTFDDTCTISSSENRIITSVKATQGLYVLPIISNTEYVFSTLCNNEQREETTLWHKRLDHIDQKALKELKNLDNNKKIKTFKDFVCEECIKAKATVHVNHSISDTKRIQYLQLVQSDLFDSVQVASFSDKKYFITFLDSYTKWLEVDVLVHKNDACKAFEQYSNREERISNHKLQTVRTDNETEYFSVSKICKERGIVYETIASYAYEQADAGERINLTLLNKIHFMLFTAKLAKEFWAEALNSAVYLYNRTSHAALDYRSSYEMRYNKKPSLNHIKIWGSIAYSKIYKAKKLDSRAKPNILVDFEKNQYKLIDLSSKRAFWSRDTVVLESVFLCNWQKNTYKDFNNEVFINSNDFEIIDKTSEDSNEFREAEVEQTAIEAENQQEEFNTTSENDIDELAMHDSSNSQSIVYNRINYQAQNSVQDSNTLDDMSDDELAFSTMHNSNISVDSTTYNQAMKDSNAKAWFKAMSKELNNFKTQKTWILVNVTNDKHVRWIYKTKLNQQDTIDKFKARWVAKNFQQIEDIDFNETFSNTVKSMIFRTLFALAAYLNLEIQ